MSTIFTKIINKEIPAHIVYEDDLCIAFLDISQATLGHTLVVPKKEVENILGLDEELAAHLFRVTVKLAKSINKAFNPSGINLLNNNGVDAFQSVMHYHIHIIPRYNVNEIDLRLPNNMNSTSKEDFETRVKQIKKFYRRETIQ